MPGKVGQIHYSTFYVGLMKPTFLGDPMASHRAQPGDGQMSLAGFIEATPKDRLFLGIFPDQPAQAAIAEVAQRLLREHGLRGQPFHPSRFHLTVHHLGDHAELQIGRAHV